MTDERFPALYARNSKGQIKKWTIKVDEVTSYGRVTISFGLLHTNNMRDQVDIIKHGKNIGKANETTPFLQALKEADSRLDAQKRMGYKTLQDLGLETEDLTLINEKLPVENTDGDGNMIPMKCQQYYKDIKKGDTKTKVVRMKFPCYGQPKYNGIRCFIKWQDGKAILFSKKGLEYSILTHIANNFTEDMFYYQGVEIVYDGEIYAPNMILSDILSAAQTYSLYTPNLKFYCFDIAVKGLTQVERLDILKQKINDNEAVCPTETDLIHDHDHAVRYAKNQVERGYEGAVFRSFNDEYGFGKRPQYITKMKFYLDQEFIIVDVVPMPRDPELGMFTCSYKGKEFDVVPEGSRELKMQYLKDRNNLIGKKLTCQFYEWTVNNVPFHAKGIAVRDYE